jgi:hypothetical protein
MATTSLLQAVKKVLAAIGLKDFEQPLLAAIGFKGSMTAVVPAMNGSLFLRLPAELRLRIYELVLTRTYTMFHPSLNPKTYGQPGQKIPPPQKSNAVALLKVNRQIHHETRLLPFQLGKLTEADYFTWCVKLDGGLSYLGYVNGTLQSLQPWQQREIRNLELGTTKGHLKRLIWREYRFVMRTMRGNVRRFRQAYPSLAQANASEGGEGWLEDTAHWAAVHLLMLTPLAKMTLLGPKLG